MKKIKNEKGMLIVEATFVFPIMFLVIFFLIIIGNAYFTKSKIQAVVTELALDGAAYCADPMLRPVDKDGAVPAFGVNPEPYRYFTKMEDMQAKIKGDLNTRLGKINTGLFSGMKPSNIKTDMDVNNIFLYSTFYIELDYKITVPVRMIGARDFLHIDFTTRAETAITDVPEFIRNVNMVEDYLEQTGAKDKITQALDKVKSIFK